MFQHHTILPDGLAAIPGGFRVRIRIGFPRGVPLSMVEGFAVDIDGTAHTADVRFRLRGRTWRVDELAEVVDRRWEMGEPADLLVACPAGLAPGRHTVTVTQFLRVGPTSEPVTTVGRRTVELVEKEMAE